MAEQPMSGEVGRRTSWRYQPVYETTEILGQMEVSTYLIEVYLQGDELVSWTGHISPVGEDPNDLRASLSDMLVDAYCWKPVNVKDLKSGMIFEGVDRETRMALQNFVDKTAHNFAQATAT